jgi:hypothetical protein
VNQVDIFKDRRNVFACFKEGKKSCGVGIDPALKETGKPEERNSVKTCR